MKVFIFGAGYSAAQFGRRAAEAGAVVAGTTRSQNKAPVLRGLGIDPLLFDGSGDLEAVRDCLAEATHLLVSIAPDAAGDPVLIALGSDIRLWGPKLEWIGYLSTVGVYGDHRGAWVDESSECRPVSRRSVDRVAAEQAWLAAADTAGVPLAVLRLSGIYGPGRNAFVNLKNGTAKRLIKKDQVFNRIHVDDIAEVSLMLAQARSGGIYNITDDEPAPPQDVVTYAAGLLGVEPPPEIPFDAAQLSPMARSFYGENKRVSNARIKAAGYRFRHPTYRQAFDMMWREGNWEDGEPRSSMRS